MTSPKETGQQSPITGLLHQIVYEKKSMSKDQRITACTQLQKHLLSLKSASDLNYNWKDLVSSLLSLMPTRINLDSKRAVAECVGAVGFVLIKRYEDFVKYILDAVKRASDKYQEEKALVFRPLASSLNFIAAASLQSTVNTSAIGELMRAVHKQLERNDSHVFLIPLLDTALVIAKHYPTVFDRYFEDVIDFAIGWYLEVEQPPTVRHKCRQLLVELRPFWEENLDLAASLMNQFVEDGEACLKEMMNKEMKPESSLRKVTGLYRSFATLMVTISQKANDPQIVKVLTKAYGHFLHSVSVLSSLSVGEVNDVFLELISAMWSVLEAKATPVVLETSVKLCAAIAEHKCCKVKSTVRVIGFLKKIMESFPTEVMVRTLPAFIGEDGVISKLNTEPRLVQRAVAVFYVRALAPKSLPLLKAAYDILRRQLHDLFGCLGSSVGDTDASLADANKWQTRVIMLLNAFEKLGSVKNSLIAMMGLSPSLFSTLLTETPISEEWLISRYPSCHFALIHAAKVLCEKHDNFIASSTWLNQRHSTILAGSFTAGYLAVIVKLLTKLLALDSNMWPETRMKVIDWVHAVTFAMSTDVLSEILDRPEVVKLRSALLDSFLIHSLPKKTAQEISPPRALPSHTSSNGSADSTRAVRVRHFTLLRRLGVFNLVHAGGPLAVSSFVQRVFETARLGDQEMGVGLWQAVPPVLFLSNGLRRMADDRLCIPQPKVPESLFSAEHFKLITDFLISSTIPTYFANDVENGNWMEDTVSLIYSSCMGDENENTGHMSKWRWVIAQVAQFCIDNRMRTQFGKPLSTFLAFENEIRRLAASSAPRKTSSSSEAISGKEDIVTKEEIGRLPRVFTRSRRGAHRDDDDDGDLKAESKQLSGAEQWWRVRALLETIEMLDKLINFATFGAVFQLSVVSQTSQQFFVTNAASCSNWMSRMCLPTMAVAYRNGLHALVIRLGGYALRDAKARVTAALSKRSKSAVELLQSGGENERVLGSPPESVDTAAHICVTWMARAFIELCGWQGILGLYAWIKQTYGVRLKWLKHAADVAAGRIEMGIDGLLKCYEDVELPENTRKTVKQLIVTALSRLRNPEELSRAYKMLCAPTDGGKMSFEVPAGFDEITWSRMEGLLTFNPPKNNNYSSLLQWDIDTRRETAELKLMGVSRTFNKDNRNELSDLTRQLGEDAQMLMVADTSFRAHAAASCLHLLATAVKDSHKTNLRQISANMFDPSFLFELDKGGVADRLVVGQQLGSWMENSLDESGVSSTLKLLSDEPSFYLKMASLARKTSNFRLANRQLRNLTLRHQNVNGFPHSVKNGWSNTADKENSLGIVNGVSNWHRLQPSFAGLKGTIEVAKLMWTSGESELGTSKEDVFSMLCDAVATEVDRLAYTNTVLINGRPTVTPNILLNVLVESIEHSASDELGRLGLNSPKRPVSVQRRREELDVLAKAVFRLADWLQKNPSLVDLAFVHANRLAWHMFAAEHAHLSISGPTFGDADDLVGTLWSVSSRLAPHKAKAYSRLGDWAYKSALDDGEDAAAMRLRNDEKQAVIWEVKTLYRAASESILNDVVAAVSEACDVPSLEEKVRAAVGRDCPKEIFEKFFCLGSVVTEVWVTARNRMISYFECAVQSYFKYISECGNLFDESGASASAIGTVVAALRILHLLVKHSDSIHSLIDSELRTTNEEVWRELLPQLFARLNHPMPAVRDTLSALLERIAEHAPHALCFPAIVGATQPIVMHGGELDDEAEERSTAIGGGLVDEDKSSSLEQDKSMMFECCQRIVRRLEHRYPKLVKDVSEFVKELQRLNMFNEERWVFTLTNLDHEMSRRIAQIERENAKTLENPHLSNEEKKEIMNEKTIVITSSVFRILEDLYQLTCDQAPTTANARAFRESYSEQIKTAFEMYKANKLEPRRAWHPFKQLLLSMMQSQRSSKRAVQCVLTADISPSLVSIDNSQIPIPGQESKSFKDVVTIVRMHRQALILPTKTRPKKIVLTGSDGKEYPYLFKGQEDLHLDERIMQLLRICNFMLSVKKSEWPPYSARHYSVTPLGSRSGLIQWVDGATPLFHVYRKWQYRQAEGQKITGKGPGDTDRPCDLFFKKLKAVFDANSISPDVLHDRTKWPLEILKVVVSELIDETPRDLLSRELWLRASNPDSWYAVTERFARSTAVMSMVGSVLGLGDRHLDNVLINLDSGHIVHIDYNVCFDKGRNLRVPELVPFRLTSNIINALGSTRIEGTFRLSCEHVMEKLRSGKEVLLTILDTFVYDPLVDWAAAQDNLVTNATVNVATMLAVYGTDARPDSWRALTRSLFLLRLREMSAAWLLNAERMNRCLSRVAEVLEKMQRSRMGVVEYGNMVKGMGADEESRQYDSERVEAGRELKNAISEHHQMMLEVRPLIRSLAHGDERFRDYLRLYKNYFSDPLIRGHKLLDDSNSPEPDFSLCVTLFRTIIGNIYYVYDQLLSLDKMEKRATSTGTLCCPPGFDDPSVVKQQRVQNQNVYARNVSRRIRQKLEGQDFEVAAKPSGANAEAAASSPRTPLSVSEQVDCLIHQATSLSNLALMYEGWTAWV